MHFTHAAQKSGMDRYCYAAAWPSVQANSPIPQLKCNHDMLPSLHAAQKSGVDGYCYAAAWPAVGDTDGFVSNREQELGGHIVVVDNLGLKSTKPISAADQAFGGQFLAGNIGDKDGDGCLYPAGGHIVVVDNLDLKSAMPISVADQAFVTRDIGDKDGDGCSYSAGGHIFVVDNLDPKSTKPISAADQAFGGQFLAGNIGDKDGDGCLYPAGGHIVVVDNLDLKSAMPISVADQAFVTRDIGDKDGDGCSYSAGGHIFVVDNLDPKSTKPISAADQAFGGHFLAGNIGDKDGDGCLYPAGGHIVVVDNLDLKSTMPISAADQAFVTRNIGDKDGDGCSYSAGGHIFVVDNLDPKSTKPISAADQAFGGHFLAGNIGDKDGDGCLYPAGGHIVVVDNLDLKSTMPISAADQFVTRNIGDKDGDGCSYPDGGHIVVVDNLGIKSTMPISAADQAFGGHLYAVDPDGDGLITTNRDPLSVNQAPGGHLRGHPCPLNVNGDSDELLPVAYHYQALGAHLRANGNIIIDKDGNGNGNIIDKELGGHFRGHPNYSLHGELLGVPYGALAGHYDAAYVNDEGGNGVGFGPNGDPFGGNIRGCFYGSAVESSTVQILQASIDGNGHAAQNSGVDDGYCYAAACPVVQANFPVPGLDSCYNSGNVYHFDLDRCANPDHSVVEGCYYGPAWTNHPVPWLDSCYGIENVIHRFDVDAYAGAGAGPAFQENIDGWLYAAAWPAAQTNRPVPGLDCWNVHRFDVDVNAGAWRSSPLQATTSTASAGPFALISEATVQSAWRGNCGEVFGRVLDELRRPRRHLYVALDLEFVAGASADVHYRPISWIDGYEHLHAFVNGGDVLQVGLALAFELQHRHGHGESPPPSSPVIALEINLEFDVGARHYNAASIDFLAAQGHCFEHRDRGVTAEQFLDGLLRHLPIGGSSVTWVTFHGDRDLGFLLRLLRPGALLPPERADFMRQVRQKFPIFYDVRVLGQLVKEGFRGGLTALAELLGVRRVGGEHHAGSDALLTMSCFCKILRSSRHDLHRLDSRLCLLSGMEEFDMGIKCARYIDDPEVKTVKVHSDNFDEEARWISELVTSNFKVVGLDVLLPQLGSGSPLYAVDGQQGYNLLKCRLEGINAFEIVIGFMNAEGMLGYGRIWKFYLCYRVNELEGGNKGPVHPRRLASLIKSCGATHSPNVAWVTHQGSHEIACLVKSLMEADGLRLPRRWCSYNEHQRACLPALCDIGSLFAQRCPDIGMHPTGCPPGGLYDIARNLKIISRQSMEKALLVLRCYKTLIASAF